MLDIEFISTEGSRSLKKFILYEHSEGAFRAEVQGLLKTACTEKGLNLRTSPASLAPTVLGERTLFGGFCLWVKPEQGSDLITLLKAVLGREWPHYLYLEVDRTLMGSTLEEEVYGLYGKGATVIREVELSSRNLSKVVPLLASRVFTRYGFSIGNLPELESGLAEYYDRVQPTLGAFKNFLERALLTCVEGNRFDLTQFRGLLPDRAQTDFLEWHKAVAALLTEGSPTQRNRTLQLVAASLGAGQEHRQITGRLFKVIQELGWANHTLNPTGTKPAPLGDYKWRNLLHYENLPATKLLKFELLLAELSLEVNLSGDLLTYKRFLDKI